MPAVNAGRENTNASPAGGKARPKRKTLKKTVTVAPADRTQERATARAKQLSKSVAVSPDRQDAKRSPAQKTRDARVVAANVKTARDRTPTLRIDTRTRTSQNTKSQAAVGAPVLKVLEQTTRPLHAIAAATDEAIHGGRVGTIGTGASPMNVLKAAGHGLQNKDKTTFSDVIKHAGVKSEKVAGAAGFVLDVGLDPTTYVTGGTGSIAEKAAAKAARKAEKKALAKGLTKDQARRYGERADAQAAKKADKTAGVTVKVAGREIPGVRQATAKASRLLRKAAKRLVPQRVREGARAVGADVNPDVAPVGVSKETSRKAVHATRTARAASNRGLHEAQQQALGIKQQVGEANYSRVIDAIEAGDIKSLPVELRDVAIRVRSQFRHANRLRKTAGIAGGEVKRRGKVPVPGVTADTASSSKTLSRARRAEERAQRDVEAARSTADVHQGRAEVLSRNVSGSSAERAAERGRSKRKSRLTPRYAAGGHGVRQTATAARDAGQRLKNATAAREAAETAHVGAVVDAGVQRRARDEAIKTNEKRAAAPREYIPHHLTDDALETEEKRGASGVGRKVIRPSSSRARSDNRPLRELRKDEPGRYDENLPSLYADRKAEGATSVARAELNRRIADLGHEVKKGRDVTLEKGESVYHVVGSDLRKVDAKEVARVLDEGGKKGRYVALNDDIVKRAIEGSQPTLQGPGIVRGLDKVQAGFKRIALATPGFHVRNLVGDTQNAYLGQPGHRLPKNLVDAGRVLKAEGRRDKSLRKLQPGEAGGGTLKTGRYGKVTYDEAAAQLSKHGAMRTGYTGRELPELSGEKATLRRVRLPRRAKQALLNREDLPRLATAVDALKRGATWEEAAQKVADFHFDYGHLTQFERQVARRAAPFYTFSARNIPLQTKSLITKPGKFANYEKLREEAAKTTGMDEESKQARDLTDQLKQAGVKLPDGWEANLSEWEARNAGVPVSWKGHKFTVSMGLPLVDLNELPGAALGDQLDEYYQKGMSLTSPIPKNVIEYMENHSFFFRDEIERENAPLVAAPEWVRGLPAGLKQKMGVTEDWIDKKTGKKGLAYRAKADYVIKSIPGTPAFLNKVATQGHDRVGKGTGGKALAFAGVKATPFDPVANAVNLAYERRGKIETQMAALRQQGVNMDHPTPEYRKLNDQLKIVTRIAYQGREQQGFKVLPTQGGPKKGKVLRRVQVPGASGRVRVPGAGGRVKVP